MKVLIFRPPVSLASVRCKNNIMFSACINNASQILVSGYPHDLEKALDAINDSKRVILKLVDLPVNIPFHNDASRPNREAIHWQNSHRNYKSPSKPIVSNTWTGRISQGECLSQYCAS